MDFLLKSLGFDSADLLALQTLVQDIKRDGPKHLETVKAEWASFKAKQDRILELLESLHAEALPTEESEETNG